LWVVDGSFLMESIAYLGREQEARSGIQYLLSFQRDDGSFMLIDGHWKETGIALWAVTRHARLTGDPAWLGQLWPKVQRGMAAIIAMRAAAASDTAAPNYRLIPAGFSDGGLGGRYPEYTNVYWTLVGMKAAVDAARWLGKADDARRWQAEYDDFYATFRKAAERDAKTDAQGNRYVPIRMRDDQNAAPQKAQWAFLHAVFPGKIFPPGDRLVEENLAMLRANECEGLVYGTGWINAGVWNYFGSFYAHAWLWTGRGQKAAETLYQFGNHASPLLVWREEQSPQAHGREICGDMPHNWASAEFIRLVRHLLVLERGEELHLCEGLPAAWIRPGAVTRVHGTLTEFGPVSLELRVSADGRAASLHLDPPRRNPARKIVLHLDGWSGRSGTLEIPTGETSDRQIPLARP
jgi:GH15 family glucan-1,4-alpha-glucosidase